MTTSVQPRRTRQRAAVADALAESPGFRTAQQVHDLLVERNQRVALATVYRTLQSLAESGEVDSIRTPDGQSAYRSCSQGHTHHHHLICSTCGHTVEIELGSFEGLLADIAHSHGFTAVAHELELFGTCADCAR